MELGSLVCKPLEPLCHECPLQGGCLAYSSGKQKLYPNTGKKLNVRHRHFHYFYFSVRRQTSIFKRPGGDIWQNLYDLPCIEFRAEPDGASLLEAFEAQFGFRPGEEHLKLVLKTKHVLTHQRIHASFWTVSLAAKPKLSNTYIWVRHDELENYAVPRLFDKFLKYQNLA